jgi:hypothetical protein
MKSGMIVFTILVAVCGGSLSYGAAQPEKGAFNLICGDYKVMISAKYKYTIRAITYKNAQLGLPHGFYGAVFRPARGQFIGAGHTQGGEEKVELVKLYQDGKEIVPETSNVYNAKEFRLVKISTFANLKFIVTIIINTEKIVEAKRYMALADQPAIDLYAFMFCWSPDTKEWCAKLANGKDASGVFKDDKSWHLRNDVKWAAIYEPSAKSGILMYFPEVLEGQTQKSTFWDVPKAYHKFYCMVKTPKLIRKGVVSKNMIIELKGFEVSGSEWKTKAAETAKALQKSPVPDAKALFPPKLANTVPKTKVRKNAKRDLKAGTLSDEVVFLADYTGSDASVDAKRSTGSPKSSLLYGSEAKFDFDTMAHTKRGLLIGDGTASVAYSLADNLPEKSGSIEIVVKALTTISILPDFSGRLSASE